MLNIALLSDVQGAQGSQLFNHVHALSMMVLRMAGGGGVHVHPMHPTGSAPANDQWADLTASLAEQLIAK